MVIHNQVSAGHAVATARKHGADATKVLQAAIGPTPAPGTNGATAPTGRATPGTTGSGPKTTPKKVYISAIVYALALPDGLDWLKRWHGGEADAVAELAATMAKPKKAAAKPKAKKAAGKKGTGKAGRKSNAAKAAEAAAAAGAAAAAAAAVTGGAPVDDDAPL
jgi:hypothetical protein